MTECNVCGTKKELLFTSSYCPQCPDKETEETFTGQQTIFAIIDPMYNNFITGDIESWWSMKGSIRTGLEQFLVDSADVIEIKDDWVKLKPKTVLRRKK